MHWLTAGCYPCQGVSGNNGKKGPPGIIGEPVSK